MFETLRIATTAPGGRIGRKAYWKVALSLVASVAVLIAASVGLSRIEGGKVHFLIMALWVVWVAMAAWAELISAIKRLHDRDKSGHWLWLYVGVGAAAEAAAGALEKTAPAPALAISAVSVAIALWMLIDLGFLRGTDGDNRFGPPPPF